MTGTTLRTHRLPRGLAVAGWALVAAEVCLLVWVVTTHLVGVTQPEPWSQWGFVDYRDTIHIPTRDLLAGHNPYDVGYQQRHPGAQMFNLYLPQQFLLLGWMAYLPRAVAVVLFCLATVAALGWLVDQGVRSWLAPAWRHAAVPFLVMVLLLRGPGVMSVRQGQLAVVLAMLSWFALTDTKRPWLQALAVSVVMIKPQTGLALMVLLLALRGIAPFLRAALTTAALALPGTILLAVNAGGIPALVGSVLTNLRISSTDDAFFGGPVDIPSCLRAMGLEVSSGLQLAITLAVALATGLGIWLGLGRGRRTPRFLVAERYPLWFIAIALVLVLPNQRYAVGVLVPPLLLTLGAWWTRQTVRVTELLAILLAGYAILRSETMELSLGLPEALTRSITGWLLLGCLVALLPRMLLPHSKRT